MKIKKYGMYFSRISYLLTPILFLVGCLETGGSKVNSSKENDLLSYPQTTKPLQIKQLHFPSDQYVMVAAHRAGGYKGTAPENSLKAIENSIKLGVDIIEIDVRLTYDKKLVVIHDKTLDRTTTGSGKISYHTLKQIKTLYLVDDKGRLTDERVPTLEEVFNTVKHKAIVFVDKAENVIEEVKAVLEKSPFAGQALFMDFVGIKDVKANYDDLLNTSYFVPALHESISNLDNYYKGFLDTFKPNPCAFAFWFRQVEGSKVFPLINQTKSKNIPVWINATTKNQAAGYTDDLSLSNPDAGWGWLINHGCNILFTDYPEQLISYLNTKKLR